MELSPAATRILAGLLEAKTGQQLVTGRHWWIETALKPLLKARGFDGYGPLVTALLGRRDSELTTAVVEALLNNETSFFRDPGSLALLTEHAVTRLLEARDRNHKLRIWCAGCSTGQEVWSLAMLLAEGPPRLRGRGVEIVGTDISNAAIARARSGIYSQREVQRGLPIRQLMRWFSPAGADWAIAPELHASVRFLAAPLADRAPAPGVFDIILCRNVLLYFSAPTRAKVFDRLASAIAPDGVLMLGAGETVIGQTDQFVSDCAARGLYRPTHPALPPARLRATG